MSRKTQHSKGFLFRLVPLAIVVSFLGGVVAVGTLLPKRDTDAAPQERPPVNVQIQVVEPLPTLADEFTLNAGVEPLAVVTLAAEVAGRVEAYAGKHDPPTPNGIPAWNGSGIADRGAPIDEGDRVTAGQPLVYLNTELLRADRDQAAAQLEYDLRDLETTEKLLERNVATPLEVEQKRTAVNRSRATLASADARLRRTAIHAPVPGRLNRLLVEEGEYVSPGTPVAEIVDTDTVKVVVDVPERDIPFLRTGDRGRILDLLGDNRDRVGEITYISETADPGTRTTRIEMSVDNRDAKLRAGQIVRVRLKRRDLQDVVMIPLKAVIPWEQDLAGTLGGTTPAYTVYIERNGQAERRDIEIDIRFVRGDQVRVLKGLEAGDRLIVSGHRLVGPGQVVKVQALDAPPAPDALAAPQALPATAPGTDAHTPPVLGVGQAAPPAPEATR